MHAVLVLHAQRLFRGKEDSTLYRYMSNVSQSSLIVHPMQYNPRVDGEIKHCSTDPPVLDSPIRFS